MTRQRASNMGITMETKKKLTVLDSFPGKNSAEVLEEERETNSQEAQYAMVLIKEAGRLFKPIGADYIGSAVIHYYSHEVLPSHPQFFVACQTAMGDVAEQHADLGWKQLKSALMKVYGRKEPKTRM